MIYYYAHPALIAAYPVLKTLAGNRMDVAWTQAIVPLAVAAAFTAIIRAAFRAAYGCPAKASLAASLFAFMFFSYGHVRNAVFSSPGPAHETALIFSGLAVFAAVALFLRRVAREAADRLNAAVFAFAAALVFMPLFTMACDAHIDYSHRALLAGTFADAPVDPAKLGSASLPNIFHIYLDEYGRQDVMNEIYNYDISEFIDYLKGKGFFVAGKSRCNYCYTDLSLLSTFNMDYLDGMVEKFGLAGSSERSLAAKKLIWDNAVFRTARKAGYKIITFNSGELYTSITDADEHYSPFSGRYHNVFYANMLLNLTPVPAFLRAAGRDPYFFYDAAERHRRIVLHPFEKIEEIVAGANSGGAPVLACLWIDSPHPPFVFDDAGNPVTVMKRGAAAIDRWAIDNDQDRRDYVMNYRKQLTFITIKTVKMIEHIIKNSKRPPVILLQSDHGPASLFEFEKMPADPLALRERFGILNAYYFGGKPASAAADAGLRESVTPVNSFRAVFNLYFGAGMKLLKDECFHSTWLRPYDFTKVTGRLADGGKKSTDNR